MRQIAAVQVVSHLINDGAVEWSVRAH